MVQTILLRNATCVRRFAMLHQRMGICRALVSKRASNSGGCLISKSDFHTGFYYKKKRWTGDASSSRLAGLQAPLIPLTMSYHHNSSYASIFNKMFYVNAESPPVGDNITSSAVYEEVSSDTLTSSSPLPDSAQVLTNDPASTVAQSVSDSIAYVPVPPTPPEVIGPALNALGEPTFQSLGIGGWTPVGLIQQSLEFLHVSVDLPWWAAISLATVCIRTMIFPLVLVAQRNAAKMNNNMPQLQVLQLKMTEARNSGNQLEAARLGQEMVAFMKEKDISPMKNVVVPLAQAPIFISMFMGLRGMASLPVESMQIGGLAWFTDLTISDPYYLLPVITSLTMMATIELGTDGARLNAQNMSAMKWVLRGMPVIIFPFTLQFPAAVLCYWVATNLFSLVQVGFLKIPAIRSYFNIERLVNHKPESLPQKKKGVVASFKESWNNMQISKEEIERAAEI
ncbi:mitochondrial inner membrane protein OXA1L-like [Penaeus japonicus]|uniref:mitochondrial inner membrane protein OXA1L-like n=1 Tax=Penaeus japonicus TaxID=27405 RepID=UPI001C70D3A7|nr:mitochondrial inner membrane protein OXA1L-like [Penaeus japonicus]